MRRTALQSRLTASSFKDLAPLAVNARLAWVVRPRRPLCRSRLTVAASVRPRPADETDESATSVAAFDSELSWEEPGWVRRSPNSSICSVRRGRGRILPASGAADPTVILCQDLYRPYHLSRAPLHGFVSALAPSTGQSTCVSASALRCMPLSGSRAMIRLDGWSM